MEEGEELPFTIPAGTVIPDGAVITDEACLQEVLNDSNRRTRSTTGAVACSYVPRPFVLLLQGA